MLGSSIIVCWHDFFSQKKNSKGKFQHPKTPISDQVFVFVVKFFCIILPLFRTYRRYNCKASVKDPDISCTKTVDKVDHISQQTLGENEEEDCTSDNAKVNSTKEHVRHPHTPQSLRAEASCQNWMKVKVILYKLWQYEKDNADKEKENAVNLSINSITMGKANDTIGK